MMLRGWIAGTLVAAALTSICWLIETWETVVRPKAVKRRLKILLGRPVQKNPRYSAAKIEVEKFSEERQELREEAGRVEQAVRTAVTEQSASNPLDPGKQTIFLIVTAGQAVRSILLTEVMTRLVARFNVVIISQYAENKRFQDEHRRSGVHIIPWFSKFKSRLFMVVQYYLMQRSGSSTHQGWLANLDARARGEEDLHRPKGGQVRFAAHARGKGLSEYLGALLGRRNLLTLYHSYLLSYLDKRLLRDLFAHYRPRLVISTTAHHVSAWPLTYFARCKRIETLAYILSWDNCSTKVTLDPYAKHYAVWSEEMSQEVRRYFPYLSVRTIIVGAPMFDMYYHNTLLGDRRDFLTRVGLPPDLPFILYATNTPAAMPDEPELIAKYWDALSQSPLSGKVGLLVRLHPADSLDRYSALDGRENLVVTVANDVSDGLESWIPDRKGMSLLLNSVKHAAVAVNVASTMSLESFAAGVPTINVAFRASPEVREKFLWRFDMYHSSEHYRALLENEAVDVARSMDELVTFTISALQFGSRRNQAMQRTLAQKVAYSDGMSARRFADVIESLVDQEQTRPRSLDAAYGIAQPS
jgi:hypothetical protein